MKSRPRGSPLERRGAPDPEGLCQKLIGMPSGAMIVDHGGDHQLIGTGRLDQRIEPRAHRRGGAGEDAPAIVANVLAVAGVYG